MSAQLLGVGVMVAAVGVWVVVHRFAAGADRRRAAAAEAEAQRTKQAIEEYVATRSATDQALKAWEDRVVERMERVQRQARRVEARRAAKLRSHQRRMLLRP